MNEIKLNKETELAIRAAEAAGQLAMKYFRKKLRVEMKADKTPVTAVDRLCDKKIISLIRKDFPGHSILSEESGLMQGNDRRWIIDPLDGTKDFIKGLPFFGVLVGLEKNSEMVCGASCLPALGMLCFAEKGRGSFVNGRRAHVSKISRLEDALVCNSSVKQFARIGKEEALMGMLKLAGSSGSMGGIYPQMLLSQGITDAVLTAASKPWDLAAPKIIIEEAGGKLTDFGGSNTIYGGNAVATNGLLHEKIIEILNK